MGIYIVMLSVLLTTEMCTQNEFYCEVRGECLPLEVLCDGVFDCHMDDELFETDESNCDGQQLLFFKVLDHVMTSSVFLYAVCEDGDVRSLHLSESEFIVEVCRDSTYLAVCSDTWDHREASVICRQLGISSGKKYALLVHIFPSCCHILHT